jgi:post-segregation antitoxin (ccd killing protein)
MASFRQISAHISVTAKDQLERHARATGITRSRLIEDALLHHLRALEELPPDAIVPARVVLSRESAEQIRKLLAHPPPPTEAMKRLFHDR